MVGPEEFMDIHELWVRGKNISQIARLTGRDRKTIRRLLAVGQRPRKPRELASKLDPFREYVLARMLAEEDPVSNAEVIYDEICARATPEAAASSRSSCRPSARCRSRR